MRIASDEGFLYTSEQWNRNTGSQAQDQPWRDLVDRPGEYTGGRLWIESPVCLHPPPTAENWQESLRGDYFDVCQKLIFQLYNDNRDLHLLVHKSSLKPSLEQGNIKHPIANSVTGRLLFWDHLSDQASFILCPPDADLDEDEEIAYKTGLPVLAPPHTVPTPESHDAS